MKALMLGSGFFPPSRKIQPIGVQLEEPEWTTLDINPECKADILFDLEYIEYNTEAEDVDDFQIPVEDGSFDEIHIYQTLEHFGRQGDYKGFFATFREFWRILKPGGLLYGDTPSLRSVWAWGDPGHTRIISVQTLSFLTRRNYEELGKTTSTDYRAYVAPCWWMLLHASDEGDRFGFVLKKVN